MKQFCYSQEGGEIWYRHNGGAKPSGDIDKVFYNNVDVEFKHSAVPDYHWDKSYACFPVAIIAYTLEEPSTANASDQACEREKQFYREHFDD